MTCIELEKGSGERAGF
jgi:hypothetical protein